MPETNAAALKEAISHLEDYSLENERQRCMNYEILEQCLLDGVNVTTTLVNKILKICIHDIKQDIQYTALSLNIVLKILERIKNGDPPYSEELTTLLPSAVAILNIIYNTSLFSTKMEGLKKICMETLLNYPDECLRKLSMYHRNKIVEFFHTATFHKVPLGFRVLFFQFVLNVLKTLPEEERQDFVKRDVSVWLSKVIPTVVTYLNQDNGISSVKCIELLELMTTELLTINYINDIHWENIFQNISNPNKYPLIMKKLLESGSPLWHRLWIVCIKLLDHQVTRNNSGLGTPINSMLPVVEAAFKIDATNRCRAFQCWSVLIDIFAKETNDNCINKRLKLLVIPLRLNNAKVEETAIAKFGAWWHLIVKFSTRLGQFTDMVLISFLHFCFGKHNASGKASFVPGQICDTLSMMCIEAFVEIVGHVACERCTTLPRLKERLLSKKYLIEYWHDWSHSMKTAINLLIQNGKDNSQKQISCIWKSFLLTVGELPDNSIRKDLITELLETLENFVQESKTNNKNAELVFNSLVITLFDEETKIKQLLKSQIEDDGVLHKAITILVDPLFNSVYRCKNDSTVILKLKPIASFIISESLTSEKHILKWVLDNLPSNDNTLKIWTALAELLCESGFNICITSICHMLIWPLKSMNLFNDVKFAGVTWIMLYNVMSTKLNKIDIHENISNILLNSNIVTQSTTYMALCALLSILRIGVHKNADSQYEKQVELLKVLINRMDNFEDIEEIFPVIVDTIVVICNILLKSKNDGLEENMMLCVKKLLKLVFPVFKEKGNAQNTKLILIENLLKSVHSVLKTALYPSSYTILSDVLSQYATNFKERSSLFEAVDSILKLNSSQNKENSPQEINNDLEICEIPKQINNEVTNKKFPTPNTKEACKRKKKETSIVNTVVENGEEFVVVKSNWKFNPKKLTENQKEKFTRKREDIPALYQDLSQSQDEFKLTKWKTDSQDSSTSKSNSKSINESSNTKINLKELPGTDVVPTIMENILADKTEFSSVSESSVKAGEDSNNMKDKKQATPKPRTPRMALKDRVFRNVRNLIEKSNTNTPEKASNITVPNNSEILVTPVSKEVNTENVVNSAPPMLLADRPSRVKRLPKKFDGVELFALKKRCQSQTDLQSNDQPVEKPKTSAELIKKSNTVELDKTVNVENKVPEDLMEVDNHDNPSIINTEQQKNKEVENNLLESSVSAEPSVLNEENNKFDNLEEINSSKEEVAIEKLNPEISATSSQESVTGETTTTVTHIVQVHSTEESTPKSSAKKSAKKKSRIEKELAIDMVEGHPFLNTPTTSEKRSTRKTLATPNLKRTSLSEKLNKTKNTKKKDSLENKQSNTEMRVDGENSDSQTDQSQSCSEDVIESSQDSTITTISVIKKTPKKIPIVTIEKINVVYNKNDSISDTQSLLKDQDIEIIESSNEKTTSNKNADSKHEIRSEKDASTVKEKNTTVTKPKSPSPPDVSQSIIFINETPYSCNENKDVDLPVNKTAVEENDNLESTENMDTQPLANNDESDDVIIINDDDLPITVSSEEKSAAIESQQVAEADTQPIEQNEKLQSSLNIEQHTEDAMTVDNHDKSAMDTEDDVTKTLTETMDVSAVVEETNDVSSPYKNDEQRKKDFLNNTIEISPIKTLSPDREDKSPSPETSSDYVVIKLTSPVHSNGEPFEKGSPEFFTEEKVSPDKRDQSPPRIETVVVNTSPSSLQSLKKNKPQVRAGGRAAQMLGLCVPDKLNSMMMSDRSDYEENKKSSPMTTPARRNLRMLYNSVGDGSENVTESEDTESFLKLRRTLPALDVSPSVPILKRKLVEITDDSTVSPANKRKRVSFHDPPVSTTVSVQKYIEPLGLRSPQNSAQKRQERQTRSSTNYKSQKRLDTAFKLDTALSKAVESFADVDILSNSDTTPSIETPPEEIPNPTTDILSGIQPLKSNEDTQPIQTSPKSEKLTTVTTKNTDSDIISKDDTQMSSLEQTPVVEVVNISELNDKDAICSQLVDCKDPIDNVAAELSSTAMKTLLVKELEGKIATIGDLAKLTELEVNRLCIKAPKVKTVKKVLSNYAAKQRFLISEAKTEVNEKIQAIVLMDVDTQTTGVVVNDVEVQTCGASTSSTCMQTDIAIVSHTEVQTKESGNKSTADVIATCLEERSDFVDQLTKQLDVPSMQKLSEKMSTSDLISTLTTKMSNGDTHVVLNKILEHSSDENKTKELSILGDYLCKKFESKDLILFCSQLLRKVHDKPN